MKTLIIASLVCLGTSFGSLSYGGMTDEKAKSTQADEAKARDLSSEKVEKVEKSDNNNNLSDDNSDSEEPRRPPHHEGNLNNRR